MNYYHHYTITTISPPPSQYHHHITTIITISLHGSHPPLLSPSSIVDNHKIFSLFIAPSREPWELLCSDVSSYTVSLHWYRFTPDLTGSLLTGYVISYKAIYPPHPTVYNVTLESFKHNYVAENMKAFTNYSFELYVFNPWGRSNSSTVVCRTEEGSKKKHRILFPDYQK